MERHDTHAILSNNSSSSNNHSYEFDNRNNKNKNIKKVTKRNIESNLNEPKLSSVQIRKINSILSKYNINSEQSQKYEDITKNQHQQKTDNNQEEEIKLDKNILSTKNFTGEQNITNNMNNNLQNTNKRKESKKVKRKKSKNNFNSNNTNKENNINIYNEEQFKNNEEKKEENKNEETKKEEIKEEPKYEEIKYDYKKGKNILKYSLSYKNNIRDTRFNNIQKHINEENKRKLKLQKLNEKNENKLLIYQQVNKQGNLLRTIKKPPMSFVTKIFKSLYDIRIETQIKQMEEDPTLFRSVKNEYAFYTKQLVKNKEYTKKLKLAKYQKIKEELKDEKIPTFSSINTSSSNSLYKTKSKSKSKKKTSKNKTKIKSKNFNKKKPNIFNKYTKPRRSISVYSKVSKEKSEEGKKSLSNKKKPKIPNVKKKQTFISERKLAGVNKNIRKYSVVNRYRGKFSNIQKDLDKNNNENTKKNKIININEKENNEIDFKKFLEEQRLRKNKQIKNYIKKHGINSYNFFYPKEPSPLLSTFKNKYSIYPTLNLDRKNSVDMGNNNNIIINNRHFYRIKSNSKRGKTFYEKESYKKTKEYNEKYFYYNDNLHLVEKHYGLEKDCPLCRAFKMKITKDELNTINYIKSMRYKKLRLNENRPKILSPNSFGFINGSEKDYSSLSRNRNSSARKSEYLDEYSQIRRNFVVLFDYFN